MFESRRGSAFVPLFLLFCVLIFATPAWAQWASNGNDLCVFTGDQSYPATATDGAGGAFVVWVDNRSGGGDLYLQRITASGAIAAGWTVNGNALCTAVNDQRSPMIAPDGSGGVFVAWEDTRAGNGDPNIYLQRITATGALSPGWPADGLAVCSVLGAQTNPTLATASGSAFMAWEDFRDGPTSDIYVQKVSGAGVAQWGAGNGVVACASGGAQTVPSIVSDQAGGAIIAWEDGRGAGSDIYAQRFNSSGAIQWTANGVSYCGAVNDQFAPHAITDGAGGAILVWDDYRDNNSDIYAQRISGAGSALWTPGGVALCNDLSEQYGGLPVSDGSGGAIVPWNDFRNGLGNLYAQRIAPAGTISWTVNGLPVSTQGDISDPVAAPDGTGGAFFVWDDVRPGGFELDLYAVRLTAAGALGFGWTFGGTLICNAANNQLRPVVTTDATGGLIASWFDERNSNYDIYSKRLALGGSTVDVPAASPTQLSLAVSPNPMRSTTSLRFVLSQAERARVEVLDLAGRVVRLLLEDERLSAGPREITWDGRDDSGGQAPVGLYFVRVATPSRNDVRKLTRLQ